MSTCNYTNDLVALSSMRSALSYALECLDRCSNHHAELERAIEVALQLSARKERESALMRRLSHYKSRVQTASF